MFFLFYVCFRSCVNMSVLIALPKDKDCRPVHIENICRRQIKCRLNDHFCSIEDINRCGVGRIAELRLNVFSPFFYVFFFWWGGGVVKSRICFVKITRSVCLFGINPIAIMLSCRNIHFGGQCIYLFFPAVAFTSKNVFT